MVLLFTPTGFLEILVFFFAVATFIVAIRFFMDSRKKLEEIFPDNINPRKLLPFGFDSNGFVIPKASGKNSGTVQQPTSALLRPVSSDSSKEEMKEIRQQLKQQQQELDKALKKISNIGQQTASHPLTGGSHSLSDQKGLLGLQAQLDKKEAEIQRLKNQELYTQNLQQRLVEVQDAFDDLQEKMQQMEKQAWEAAELNIQLEHAEQAQMQAEKALYKKEEKLREVSLENQRLQEAFNDLEDRLTEVNLQRQQLQKKVQLLESLNTDMMQMSEASRKLKTEMARVAELESMLHLMTEGRNR